MSLRHRPETLLVLLLASACSSSAASHPDGPPAPSPDTAPALSPDAAPTPPDAASSTSDVAASPDSAQPADSGLPVQVDAAAPADGNSLLYTCTFNATGMYPLGGEHAGHVIFGTVIDTTPEANRARVGDFQNALVATNQLKFVWPNILAAGHTYEIALFEDFNKNRTCAGAAGGNEAQWLFPVPKVTGDFTFNFTHNTRVASCQDFPMGPVP
jgi:hypothetical protein